jgi:hypothetical protein
MLLSELPTLRQDKGMMRAYMFLLDFLEAVGGETNSRISAHQQLMRGLLEAAKISEAAFDDFIARKAEKVPLHIVLMLLSIAFIHTTVQWFKLIYHV